MGLRFPSFFADSQVTDLASLTPAPGEEEEKEKEKTSSVVVFFKHHLTLTVLADPSHQQTRCLCGGGVRGQTGAEVNKGHKSKMEGERREEEEEEEEEQRPVFMCL